MSEVTVRTRLRYRLPIEARRYGELSLRAAEGGTDFSRRFNAIRSPLEEQEYQAIALLRLINRLLRWYRSIARDAAVTEVTRTEASPFLFVDEDGQPWGPNGGEYTFAAAQVGRTDVRSSPHLSAVLAHVLVRLEAEPDVWDLLLLDAEVAVTEGRYREAVLASWSAIESCFNTGYESLIKEEASASLGGLSSAERNALIGRDISLSNKMTAGLRLLGKESLHRVLADQWPTRQTVYGLRNQIVHRGAGATESEAAEALDFARFAVARMKELWSPEA